MAEIDVREDLRLGREPFQRIMEAVRQLGPDEPLELFVPFEPFPLYTVLEQRGFDHEASEEADGSWHVTFRRPPDEADDSR